MHIKGKVVRLGVAALTLAALAGGTVVQSSPASAQAPSSVPVARFYGNATLLGNQPITNLTITANEGRQTCSGTQANVNGSAVLNNASYFVDIQAVPGCTTPGSTVTFTAGGLTAKQTGTIPDIPGTAVHLNLDFQPASTPTAAPTPPPPPRPSSTTAPPPPPRPSATTPPPPPAQTPRATPPPANVQRGVVQQAPKGPVKAQGPEKKESQGPSYGRGGGYYAAPSYQAPATSPRLPSTGTGGLLDEQTSNGLTGWALAVIVLAALGVSATGLLAYRRGH